MINSCNNCETCPFESDGHVEYQEMHVTVKIANDNLSLFESHCKDYGGKAITIQLPVGENKEEIQTMSSISFKGSRTDAYKKSKELSDLIGAYATVERIKLECSIFHSDFENEKGYFEGHLVVDVDQERLYGLRNVVKSLDSHLSKNAFKEGVYMVTHRSCSTKKGFVEHMDRLKMEVNKGYNVRKVICEFCYYDSNKYIDDNWIKSKE